MTIAEIAAPYPATIAAMQSARETETDVDCHYTEFGRRAQAEGYRGVAYLFAAFATSELVHATNVGKGHADAMTMVRYAWDSEKQHRDKVAQIRRWTGAFFEQVARTIDEKTGRYFICQICGSTVNVVPAGPCAVCKYPSTHYRGIEPPG